MVWNNYYVLNCFNTFAFVKIVRLVDKCCCLIQIALVCICWGLLSTLFSSYFHMSYHFLKRQRHLKSAKSRSYLKKHVVVLSNITSMILRDWHKMIWEWSKTKNVKRKIQITATWVHDQNFSFLDWFCGELNL